jgi:hypothetical protein
LRVQRQASLNGVAIVQFIEVVPSVTEVERCHMEKRKITEQDD